MLYKFEIKESDMGGRHWLIIKREEKTDGFYFTAADLNSLRIKIENYLNRHNESEDE